jgi:hypothetical protein
MIWLAPATGERHFRECVMFVYLDESGDTGFRFKQGSTRYFVLTLLLVEDPIPIQSAIERFRQQRGLPPGGEFKFTNSPPAVREAFLKLLVSKRLFVRALVVDKTLMTQPHMRRRDTFYNYLVRLILEHDGGTIQDALPVLDESVKNRKTQDQLGSYLRHALNTNQDRPRLRGTVHHGSHTDNLIQAADMVSGAVYYAYHRGDDRYLNIIRPLIG